MESRATTPTHDPDHPPSEADVLGWVDSLKNWGRWGASDELGTLNLITPTVRRRGAGLVREGIAVPMAWELDAPSHDGHGFVHRYMIESGESAALVQRDESGHPAQRARYPSEYLAFAYHGLLTTHLDAPPYCLWDGQMYNGFSAGTITTRGGASHGGVHVARQGFSGRGILIDLGQYDRAVFPSDVEEAERRQGVWVEPGDMVLLRVGVSARRKAGDTSADTSGGWQAAMLPWFRERDVALVGSDSAQEPRPTGYQQVDSPIHVVGLVSMGLWLLDNCDLEDLASTCARLERWEFQLSIQPLPVRGGTGSPVAPIAMF